MTVNNEMVFDFQGIPLLYMDVDNIVCKVTSVIFNVETECIKGSVVTPKITNDLITQLNTVNSDVNNILKDVTKSNLTTPQSTPQPTPFIINNVGDNVEIFCPKYNGKLVLSKDYFNNVLNSTPPQFKAGDTIIDTTQNKPPIVDTSKFTPQQLANYNSINAAKNKNKSKKQAILDEINGIYRGLLNTEQQFLGNLDTTLKKNYSDKRKKEGIYPNKGLPVFLDLGVRLIIKNIGQFCTNFLILTMSIDTLVGLLKNPLDPANVQKISDILSALKGVVQDIKKMLTDTKNWILEKIFKPMFDLNIPLPEFDIPIKKFIPIFPINFTFPKVGKTDKLKNGDLYSGITFYDINLSSSILLFSMLGIDAIAEISKDLTNNSNSLDNKIKNISDSDIQKLKENINNFIGENKDLLKDTPTKTKKTQTANVTDCGQKLFDFLQENNLLNPEITTEPIKNKTNTNTPQNNNNEQINNRLKSITPEQLKNLAALLNMQAVSLKTIMMWLLNLLKVILKIFFAPVKILIAFINYLIQAIIGAITFNFKPFKDLIAAMIPSYDSIFKIFLIIIETVIPNFAAIFSEVKIITGTTDLKKLLKMSSSSIKKLIVNMDFEQVVKKNIKKSDIKTYNSLKKIMNFDNPVLNSLSQVGNTVITNPVAANINSNAPNDCTTELGLDIKNNTINTTTSNQTAPNKPITNAAEPNQIVEEETIFELVDDLEKETQDIIKTYDVFNTIKNDNFKKFIDGIKTNADKINSTNKLINDQCTELSMINTLQMSDYMSNVYDLIGYYYQISANTYLINNYTNFYSGLTDKYLFINDVYDKNLQLIKTFDNIQNFDFNSSTASQTLNDVNSVLKNNNDNFFNDYNLKADVHYESINKIITYLKYTIFVKNSAEDTINRVYNDFNNTINIIANTDIGSLSNGIKNGNSNEYNTFKSNVSQLGRFIKKIDTITQIGALEKSISDLDSEYSSFVDYVNTIPIKVNIPLFQDLFDAAVNLAKSRILDYINSIRTTLNNIKNYDFNKLISLDGTYKNIDIKSLRLSYHEGIIFNYYNNFQKLLDVIIAYKNLSPIIPVYTVNKIIIDKGLNSEEIGYKYYIINSRTKINALKKLSFSVPREEFLNYLKDVLAQRLINKTTIPDKKLILDFFDVIWNLLKGLPVMIFETIIQMFFAVLPS